MAIKLVDELQAMGNFPIAHAEGINLVKEDGTEDNLQNLFDNGELGGGGDSSVTLTQEEYEALPEEERLDGLYYTYDTKRIYKNGVQYGASEPIPLTMEEYKALKEAGAIDEKQEYLVEADAEGILLGAEDIGYNNAESGIEATTVQGAIDKVAEKIDGLIDDEVSDSTVWSSKKTSDELTTKANTSSITMVDLGFTKGEEVPLEDFILAISRKMPRHHSTIYKVTWTDAKSAYVVFGDKKININGGTLYCSQDNVITNAWTDFSVLYTPNISSPNLYKFTARKDSDVTNVYMFEYPYMADTTSSTTSTWSSSKIASTMPTTRSLTLKSGYAGYITEIYDPTTKVVVYNVNVSGTFKGLGNAIATGLKVPKDATSSSDVMHTTLGLYGTTNVSTGDAQFTRLLVRSYSNPFLDVDIQGEYIINGTITYVTA